MIVSTSEGDSTASIMGATRAGVQYAAPPAVPRGHASSVSMAGAARSSTRWRDPQLGWPRGPGGPGSQVTRGRLRRPAPTSLRGDHRIEQAGLTRSRRIEESAGHRGTVEMRGVQAVASEHDGEPGQRRARCGPRSGRVERALGSDPHVGGHQEEGTGREGVAGAGGNDRATGRTGCARPGWRPGGAASRPSSGGPSRSVLRSNPAEKQPGAAGRGGRWPRRPRPGRRPRGARAACAKEKTLTLPSSMVMVLIAPVARRSPVREAHRRSAHGAVDPGRPPGAGYIETMFRNNVSTMVPLPVQRAWRGPDCRLMPRTKQRTPELRERVLAAGHRPAGRGGGRRPDGTLPGGAGRDVRRPPSTSSSATSPAWCASSTSRASASSRRRCWARVRESEDPVADLWALGDGLPALRPGQPRAGRGDVLSALHRLLARPEELAATSSVRILIVAPRPPLHRSGATARRRDRRGPRVRGADAGDGVRRGGRAASGRRPSRWSGAGGSRSGRC